MPYPPRRVNSKGVLAFIRTVCYDSPVDLYQRVFKQRMRSRLPILCCQADPGRNFYGMVHALHHPIFI